MLLVPAIAGIRIFMRTQRRIGNSLQICLPDRRRFQTQRAQGETSGRANLRSFCRAQVVQIYDLLILFFRAKFAMLSGDNFRAARPRQWTIWICRAPWPAERAALA
jgi:hypothetical protein